VIHAAATHPDDHDTTLEVVRALWSVHHALEAASERMEASIGLTAAQRIVVRTLGRFPGTTPGRLAELLGVHPGTISTQIRRLEARGLVTRLRDPRDARRVMLGLTLEGRAFDRPMDGTVEQALHAAIGEIPSRDLETTLATLRSFREALARVGKSTEPLDGHGESR
jgi:DNA-binding MarR family transcriptional regulator